MAAKPQKGNLSDNLAKLGEITGWFEAQREIDVEAGLEKVKEAAALIKESKRRLAEIENEFEEVKRDIESDIAEEEADLDE